MLLSLVLFGSRARGDHRLSSDIDLLGVIEGGSIKQEVSNHGTSFYQYPLEALRAKARNGDLFFLHIKTEGVILHDTAGVISDVYKLFCYKDSYHQEIKEGSSIIWFLLDRPALLKSPAMRKRLVWGMRTIIIARLAESRTPGFSSAALATFAKSSTLRQVIDDRFEVSEELLAATSREIALSYGLSRPDLDWPEDLLAQQEMLRSFGGVAQVTVDGMPQKTIQTFRAAEQASALFYI